MSMKNEHAFASSLCVFEHLLEWKQTEMEKTTSENSVERFKEFLNEICKSIKDNTDENEGVPTRLPNPRVTQEEIEGECLDWCSNYLSTRKCPPVLAAHLSHETYCQVSKSDLESFLDETELVEKDENNTENSLIEYCSEKLHQFTISTLESLCCQWQQKLPDLQIREPVLESSFHAIKNVRRKMEDSHVIVPDLNALFGLKDEPAQSFYAVYDGHAGTEASLFTSKHLQCQLVHRCPLNKNPEQASKSAFSVTDDLFIPKAKRERWRSGCTGVTALVRDNKIYLSWLGDSQAVLVKEGKAVSHMELHKPERQDERDRIESQGGFVMKVGDTYRVGGNLAVSRAIGDVGYKPFVSSEAEVQVFEMDGTEEYMVLACDGLWDVVMDEELPKLVYNYMTSGEGDRSSVARYLVQHAKDNDSFDNISVIVVFFRDILTEPFCDPGLFNFLSVDSQGSGHNAEGTDDSQNKGGGMNDEENRKNNSDGSDIKGNNSGGDFIQDDAFVVDRNEINHGDIELNAQDGITLAQNSKNSHNKARISRELDLDYYGIFNTRFNDGHELSNIDDENSSTLLRNIADSVLNRTKHAEFDEDDDEEFDLQLKENVYHQNHETRHWVNSTIRPEDVRKRVKKLKKLNQEQKAYNVKGLATSPICWAFTGKNVPSVQNHRLNMAAKTSLKGSNPTTGELTLAAKAPPVLSKLPPFNPMENKHAADIANVTKSHTKLEALHPLRPKVLANTASCNSSNFRVYGSKASLQPEMKKFHSSWRPRKPLKPITTVVYEMPPTPFLANKLGASRQH